VRHRPRGHDAGVERVLRAVGVAHLQTGAPVMVPHPSRHQARPGGRRTAARSRRRARPGPAGPQRRLHRRRPPQRAGRGRLPARHGPLRPGDHAADRGPGRDRGRAGPPRLRPSG
jgi:hypothetical protein